jgi:hypothetical protein
MRFGLLIASLIHRQATEALGLSEEVEKTTMSNEAVQDLIDSAEILKQLHDEILAQIEKFDELAEKISSMKGSAS